MEGEALVIQEKGKDIQKTVGKLYQSDYFGERALVSNEVRDHTVKADSRLVCLGISKIVFDKLLLEHMPKKEENLYVDIHKLASHERREMNAPSSQPA